LGQKTPKLCFSEQNAKGREETVTKEEIITAIQQCAKELGHTPTLPEFQGKTGITEAQVRRRLEGWGKAVKEAGLARSMGTRVDIKPLFEDWAGIVRRTGRLPSQSDYAVTSQFSVRPLLRRFGRWTRVPVGLLKFGEENGLAEEWCDVLELIRLHYPSVDGEIFATAKPMPLYPRAGRRLYGPAMTPLPLAFGPANEMGVVFLFGMLARKLGFIVTWIGTEFPDCEAMQEVAPGKCQLVNIEFEFESANFHKHGHDVSKCDVIVCWRHNWADCPLQVVELEKIATWKMMTKLMQALEEEEDDAS
jgi:HNH endonuclease